MSRWEEIAKDDFLSAQCLGNADHWRSCVSRAYYAAFSAVTHALTGKATFRWNWETPKHNRVVRLIGQHLNDLPSRRVSELKAAMRRLYNQRIDADYKSGRTVDEATARCARRDAYTVFQCLGLRMS